MSTWSLVIPACPVRPVDCPVLAEDVRYVPEDNVPAEPEHHMPVVMGVRLGWSVSYTHSRKNERNVR